MGLTRDQILAANDIKLESVDCPEWGDKVFVKLMSGSERDLFESAHIADPSKDFRARLAVATVCDEAGILLFRPEDVEAVGKKSSAVLDRIFAKAVKLNAISNKDVEDLGNA